MSSNFEISYLLNILPANLKIQLTRFMYKDSIAKVPFLQKRSDRFYLTYMEKLKPMRFDPYQLIWEKGQRPKDVYMILGGIITNEETDRVQKTGMMFGQDEILFK